MFASINHNSDKKSYKFKLLVKRLEKQSFESSKGEIKVTINYIRSTFNIKSSMIFEELEKKRTSKVS